MTAFQFKIPANYRKGPIEPDENYQKLKKYLEEKGIMVCEDLPHGFALTGFNGRFVIHVNPNARYDDVLRHEVLHILRGDFFVKGKDLEAWNKASDVVINEICGLTRDERTKFLCEHPEYVYLDLPDKIVEGMKETGGKIILWDSSLIPPELDWKQGATPIYEWLMKQKDRQEPGIPVGGNQIGESEGEGYCFTPLDEGDEIVKREWERLKREIIKDLLDGKVPEDLGKDIKDDIIKRFDNQQSCRGVSKRESEFEGYVLTVEPKKNRILDDILPVINALEPEDSENSTLLRSYHREGRIEGLPREIDVPSVSILFVLDVSGSMYDSIQEIASAIRYCQLHYSVDKIFFSDGAKFASADDVKFYNSGYGTNYSAALEIMAKLGKRWDVIVLITDYIFTAEDLARLREIEKYGRYVFYYDEKLDKIDVKSKMNEN
jgi:hypothetical protein